MTFRRCLALSPSEFSANSGKTVFRELIECQVWKKIFKPFCKSALIVIGERMWAVLLTSSVTFSEF